MGIETGTKDKGQMTNNVTKQQAYEVPYNTSPYFGKSQKIGYHGELWAIWQLEQLGYQARLLSNFCSAGVDALINGVLPCEIKFSHRTAKKRRQCIYPRWQWNVAKVDTKDRVLILIAQDTKGKKHPFVMPGAVMATRSKFEINSHPNRYGGLIKPFLGCWETVDFLLEKRYKNSGQLQLPQWEV